MTMDDDKRAQQRVIEQIYAIVHAIPAGKVLSYGEVGRRSDPPISGYICGRIVRLISDEAPWWRVVGKDGNLPIRKRHPELSVLQREKLESEGVGFTERGDVDMTRYSAAEEDEEKCEKEEL